MKTITIILTLVILIGFGPKNQDNNQTKIRTEKFLESEKDKENRSKNDKKNESKTMCNYDSLVDLQKDVKVKLFDHPNGQIIDSLTNDIKGEGFLTFTIYESKDEFFIWLYGIMQVTLFPLL